LNRPAELDTVTRPSTAAVGPNRTVRSRLSFRWGARRFSRTDGRKVV